MTINQILAEQMKKVEEYISIYPDGEESFEEVDIEPEEFRSFFHSYTRKLIESVAEEMEKKVEAESAYSYWLGMRSGVMKFDKSGVCGSASPVEGLTIKQYIENSEIEDMIESTSIEAKEQRLKVKEIITNLK